VQSLTRYSVYCLYFHIFLFICLFSPAIQLGLDLCRLCLVGLLVAPSPNSSQFYITVDLKLMYYRANE